MSEQVRRLAAFPRNDLLPEPAITGKVGELELLERFGPPTAVRDEAAFDDPRQFWDLQWSCGLIMAIEYHQLSEEIIIHLDAPDIEHALRHLGVELRNMEQSFDLKRDRFDRLNPRPVEGLWCVVAESSAGERTVVSRNITQRDAACRRNEYVANDRTLTYRIEPTTG
jgi:hypothetical protein